MQAITGGSNVYPNLQEVADLFRALINDTANNTQGNGVGTLNQAGVIMPNSNPDLLTFMKSGIRTMYSDLRNVGDPELIIDNYNLIGIPPLTQSDPAVQVALSYAGYFDGYQWHAQWTLPVGLRRILAMRERQSGTDFGFRPMTFCPFGLPSYLQGNYMGYFETREGMVSMPGALIALDLQIRGRITYPASYNTANLNFTQTYVPILGCADWVAAKMLVRYAMRFAPEQLMAAKALETEEGDKVKLEVVRGMQAQENSRAEFGAEATGDFQISWAWL